MSFDASEKTKWVSASLDEDTYRALNRRATELGMHPSVLLECYLIRGITEDAKEGKGEKASIETRVFVRLSEIRGRGRTRAQLQQIAYDHIQDPTEEKADMLRSYCKEAGFTIEEILEEANDVAQIPLTFDDGTGVISAMHWLRSTLRDHPDGLPSTGVMDAGAKHGFSQHVLNDAKRRLGVKSVRHSTYWAWILEEEENENE